MSKTRDLLVLRNSLLKLSKQEVEEIEDLVYDDEVLMCVDCVHLGDDLERKYTWFIPQGKYLDLDIDNEEILVVEQLVGVGVALVKVVNNPYTMSKADHEANIHPYCQVIKNLGYLEQFLR